MTDTLRRLLAHRRRHLALIALALAATTTLALMTTSPRRPGHGTPQPSTNAPPTHTDPGRPAPTDPGAAASTDRPSQTPTALYLPDAGGTPNAPGPGQTTKPAERTNTRTPTPPGTQEPADLLKRQDRVPAGVPEQVEFFLGGGRGCLEDPPGPPHIAGAAPLEETPTELKLCFFGFDISKPLTVTFTPPSDLAYTVVLPPPVFELYFTAQLRGLPGDPIGQYVVAAEQDRLHASLRFTLKYATSPRLWLVRRPQPPTPGGDFDLYLGGFTPNSPTPLHLYDAETGRYRTSFTAPIDARGQAHVVIDTKPDDPPGCYGILSILANKPDDKPDSVFCIFPQL